MLWFRFKPNVNEEYEELFRTKSFGETRHKISNRKNLNGVRPSSSSFSSSTTSSSLPRYINPSNGFLEKQEEFLVNLTNVSKVNDLVMEYFKVDLEVCKACEDLLGIVRQMKENYRLIKSVIKLAKRVLHGSMDDDSQQEYIAEITRLLGSDAIVENPLSSLSQVKFGDMQIVQRLLLKKLKIKFQRVNRRRKIKKAMGFNLMASFIRLAFSLLAFIFNRIVGFLEAQPWFGGRVGPTKKFRKVAKKAVRKLEHHGELSTQLDVAARGVYTLINDFDILNRLGWRLLDEIEHGKCRADICIRIPYGAVGKEVVKELEGREIVFVELLEEFEKHVRLCLQNVERSETQLVDKIIGKASA